MRNYETLYQNALMADAAYIDFSQYSMSSGGALRAEFLKRGFTAQQVDDFFVRYEVKHYQPNNSSGFSAIAFVDKATEPKKITVAFRGTEPPDSANFSSFENFFADLKQDLLLARGVSELNPFSQDNYIEAFLYELRVVDASGDVLSGYEQSINIVGHSLGGYLTAMAAVDNPDLIDQAYTFNGAGLAGIDLAYNALVKPYLLGKKLDQSRFHNFYAEAGYEITAGQGGSDYLSYFGRPGSRTPLFIEAQGDASFHNHSMIHLVNALSVGRLLAYLDDTKTIEFVDNLLWQASNKAIELSNTDGTTRGAVSLDSTVQHLSTILGGDFSAYSTTNDAAKFYLDLEASDAEFRLLGSEDVIRIAASFSGEDTQDTPEARAVMYALLEGAPFSLVPVSGYADGIFADATDNEKYDASRYSEAFIRDKSDHLSYLMARNKADIDSDFDARESTNPDAEDTLYIDLNLQQNNLTVGDTAIGNLSDSTRNIIFGDGGNNDTTTGAFDGSKNDDRLYGMVGNDTLIGREGDDYLEGGQGNDTYTFNFGDGEDIIFDPHRDGESNTLVIQHEEGASLTTLTRLTQQGDSKLYSDEDEQGNRTDTSYIITGEGENKTLRIVLANGGGSIEVKGFNEESFGIELEESEPENTDVAVEDATITVYPRPHDNFYFERNYVVFDVASIYEDGITYSAEPREGFGDGISDFGWYEEVSVEGGIERIHTYYVTFSTADGQKGEGGKSLDEIVTIDLERESERFFGSLDDQSVPHWIDLQAAFDALEPLSGERDIYGYVLRRFYPGFFELEGTGFDDVFYGHHLIDRLNGDDGNDYLNGLDGDDLLRGGLGDDIIYGGAGNDAIYAAWDSFTFVRQEGDKFIQGAYLEDESATNYLYAEDGDDILIGEGGQDFLDGGEGNDHLIGNGYDDVLLGGEGKDLIFGDGDLSHFLKGGKNLFADNPWVTFEEDGFDKVNY